MLKGLLPLELCPNVNFFTLFAVV